jgi:hypothetical protein
MFIDNVTTVLMMVPVTICVQIDQAISHPLRNRDGARIQCRRSSYFDRRSPNIMIGSAAGID